MSRIAFAFVPILALLCMDSLFSQPAALDDAAAAFQQGRAAEADQKLNLFLQDHPADLRALILKGAVLDTLKRWDEAETYYQRALKAGPNSAQVLNNVANHYVATGDRGRAREFYLKAVAIDPHHPNANLQLAQMCVDEKKGGPALQYLSQLSQSDAADAGVLLLRARALALDGQCSHISEMLGQINGQEYPGSNLEFSIGTVYADCKLYHQAEESFSRALNADPADFDMLYNLGLAALEAGHWDRAAKALETALQQRPDDSDCLVALARAYLKQERLEDASALLRKSPERPDALLLLAEVSVRLESYKDAAAAFSGYLKLRPDDDIARRERGYALARAHEYEGALADLDWYVAKHPQDAAARYSRALLNIEDEKPLAAIQDLRFVLERNPNDARALLQLGSVYLAAHKSEDAVEAFKRATPLLGQLKQARRLSKAGGLEGSIQLGRDLLEDGNAAEGLNVFRDLRSHDPDPATAARCGRILVEFEQYGPAKEFLEPAIAANPSLSAARLDLAIATFQLGNPQAALAELDQIPEKHRNGDFYLLRTELLDDDTSAIMLDQAMQRAPTRPDLYLQAAQVSMKRGHNDKALALLELGSRLLPDDRDVLMAHAVALSVMPRDEDALKLLAKAEAKWPEWDRPYLVHGIILETQRRSAEARQILGIAIALGASTPQAFYYLALAITHDAQNDLESAQRAIDRALALAPKDPYALLLAGKISLARKQFPAAIERLSQATHLLPALIPAHYALHDAYQAIGDERKSAAELEAIQQIADQHPASEKNPFPAGDLVLKARPPG